MLTYVKTGSGHVNFYNPFVSLKGPLTCKFFIAEIDSVLLVDKLRGTLSCNIDPASNDCVGEKLEDEFAKIYHIVISDVIKTGLSAVRHGCFKAET